MQKFNFKKGICALLVTVLMFSLVACSSGKGISAGRKTSTLKLENINTVDNGTNIQALSGAQPFHTTPQTTKGSYFLRYSSDGTHQNIFYLDFATNTYNYLCDKPGCTHDNDSCNSYIEDTGYVVINCTPNNILLVSNNTIIKANLDGSDKQLIFNDNAVNVNTVIDQNFYANDDYLFFFKQTSGPKPYSVLMQCPLNTGEAKEIFKTSYTCNIADISGSTMFLTSLQDTGKVYSQYTYKMDIENPNLDEQIDVFEEDSMTSVIIDNSLYKCDYTAQQFTKHDYTTNTEQTIPFEIPFTIADNQKLQVLFYSYLDGKVLVTFSNIDKYEQPPDTYGDIYYYTLDFEAGKLVENTSLISNPTIPVVGIMPDLYYVYIGYAENLSDGDMIYDYASITKEDFDNGVKNYNLTQNLALQ